MGAERAGATVKARVRATIGEYLPRLEHRRLTEDVRVVAGCGSNEKTKDI